MKLPYLIGPVRSLAFKSEISKWPLSALALCHGPDESQSAQHYTHTKKKISILVLAVAAECIPVSIYSAWVMLGFGGCWALWETIQLLGWKGRVSRRGDALNRMIMSGNRLWKSQRGEVTHKHTHRSTRHILCCGFLVILGLQIKELGLSCFKCCKRQGKSHLWVSLLHVK